MTRLTKEALVPHGNEAPVIGIDFGYVQRIVTGGEGGVANVHVITISSRSPHAH